MRVWINKEMTGEETGWELSSGRHLILVNKTGQSGRCIVNVNLGYVRKKRTHYIFLNKPLKRPSDKTVGIFVWDGEYVAYTGERFVGISRGRLGIDGMFGIYSVGTLIETSDGSEFELRSEAGWVQIR